mmetsp:Transcript_25591/g.49946  ORF Transcript_25591/g.49946 Transcript_25591/m.49946 type:complete len:264 (-) Transcript_25591:157-948(-)
MGPYPPSTCVHSSTAFGSCTHPGSSDVSSWGGFQILPSGVLTHSTTLWGNSAQVRATLTSPSVRSSATATQMHLLRSPCTSNCAIPFLSTPSTVCEAKQVNKPNGKIGSTKPCLFAGTMEPSFGYPSSSSSAVSSLARMLAPSSAAPVGTCRAIMRNFVLRAGARVCSRDCTRSLGWGKRCVLSLEKSTTSVAYESESLDCFHLRITSNAPSRALRFSSGALRGGRHRLASFNSSLTFHIGAPLGSKRICWSSSLSRSSQLCV